MLKKASNLYLVIVMLLFSELSSSDPIFTISNSSTETIDKHGTCRKITNNSGKALMVATATSAEWLSFVNNATITDVVVSDCSVYSPLLVHNGCYSPTGTAIINSPVTLYFWSYTPVRLHVNGLVVTSGEEFSHTFSAGDEFYFSQDSCNGIYSIDVRLNDSSGDIVQSLTKGGPPCTCP